MDDDLQLVCCTNYSPHGYNFGEIEVKCVTSQHNYQTKVYTMYLLALNTDANF